MKLLVLYQAENPPRDHPGYFEGFERLVAERYLEHHAFIGYMGVARTRGWDAVWREACRIVEQRGIDTVFLHFFHTPMPDPSGGLNAIRNLPSRPTIFASLGDPYGRWVRRVPMAFRTASRLSDLTFLTGMGYLAQQLAASGSRNLVLMPNGCCQVRFSSPGDVSEDPEFYVSFVGNRITSRNPLSHFFWVAKKRVAFVEACSRRYGKRFGLFGKGWQGNSSWQGPTPYASQQQAYRRSAVILGGRPNAYYDYYTSDRVFIATSSGVPLVDYWVPGVDRLLEQGREWWLARDEDEMFCLCDKLLQLSGSERHALGAETRSRILAGHTQYHRCLAMVQIVNALQQARRHSRVAARPALDYLGKGQRQGPPPESVVAWQG